MQNFCVFWMLLLQDDEAQFRLECWQHSNASLTMKDADKSQKKHGACSVGSEVTSSSRKCFLTTAARCHSRARRGIATWHLWLPAGFARAPRLSGNVLKALAESTPKSINDLGTCLDLDLLAIRELVDIDTGVMRFHPSGFAVDAHQLLLVNDIVMHDARHLDLVCTGSICVQDHLLVLKMFGGNPRPISCSDRAWSWLSSSGSGGTSRVSPVGLAQPYLPTVPIEASKRLHWRSPLPCRDQLRPLQRLPIKSSCQRRSCPPGSEHVVPGLE